MARPSEIFIALVINVSQCLGSSHVQCIIKPTCPRMGYGTACAVGSMLELTWISSHGRCPHVPSTDPPESSDLGLSFSEPLAEQAKELWTLSGALHGHHPERFTSCPAHCATLQSPPLARPSLEHGKRGPQWALRLPPRQGPVFGVRRDMGTVPWVHILYHIQAAVFISARLYIEYLLQIAD